MLKVRLPFGRPGAVPLLILLAGGCSDLAGPAATIRAPAPSISASYLDIEEPQSLGSPQEVPANAGLGVPGWEQASNVGPLPDSAWIVIEVRGTVLHAKHPWCDQLFSASGGCIYTLDGVRLGPLERHGGSGVVVTLESPGVVPHPFFSSGYYQYAPDGNVHGDVARTVVRNTTGPKVLWFRRLDATPKPGNATTGLYGPMYYMSSDQKVTARVIPSPLRVDAPATVPPHEVATFSVSPTSDFKFHMPDSRRHFVYWRFFPGDTAARPNPFGPRQDVPCDGVVCRWEPPQNGRMWAFTYVDGFGVDAQSQIVRIGQPELKLECRNDDEQVNTVTRGEQIHCTLFTEPNGGEIEVEQWWFVGTDSRGQEYRYDQEDAPAASWSGEMALSGTVHVRARVDGGAPIEKSVAVTVTSRSWDDQTIEFDVQRVGFNDFPERRRPPLPPGNVRHLGRTNMTAAHLSRSEPGVLKFIQDDGPNSLLAYLGKIPLEAAALVLVSPAMDEGSNFYRAQRVDPPAFSDKPPCVQRDFDRYIRLILDHEGYPANPESHTGVFISELTPRARVVEDVVGPNDALQELQTIWETRLEAAVAQAILQADEPVDDKFAIPFGCEFNFRVGR